MKIALTGATGFVGSHTAEHLVAAGHDLRVLARDADRATRILATRRVVGHESVIGDMTDAGACRELLNGCDAVIHTAASVAIGRDTGVTSANAIGTRNIVDQAASLGLERIVYVSSVAALFPPRGKVMRVDDEVGDLTSSYGRSKVDGEHHARGLQARGAPVVIVYPAGVYGPEDPGFGATAVGLQARLRHGWPITTGGSTCVDVRDLAAILTASVGSGHTLQRVMAGGHFLSWAAEADLCEELTGRKVRRVPAPPRLVNAVGHLVDGIKWLYPAFSYPLTREAARYLTGAVPCDSERTCRELGVGFRPMAETFADTIRWMVRIGQLSPDEAGRLAS